MATNAQLQVGAGIVGPIAANELLRLNGTGNGTGALLNTAGANTWAGNIEMDSDSYFGAAAGTSLNITGQISDTGSGHNLTKVGDGQIFFAYVGTALIPGGNTYRGSTTINDGTLTIESPSSLGEGAVGGTAQSGTPQAETLVNYNATTGVAGTLQLDFTTLEANDPNGVLQNPALPYNAATNPYIGFQVFNELLVLNGPGFNGLGALNNLNGDNIWGGSVQLGSSSPNNTAVSIGANGPTAQGPNTDLNIEGLVSDPNRQPELDINGSTIGSPAPANNALDTGRVIFSNDNTYTGNTFVIQGELNVRDSHALGNNPTDPTPGGVVTVGTAATPASGAALELQVDSGLDGTGTSVGVNTHNRNLGFDTITGSGPGQEVVVTGAAGTFTLSFNGSTTGALAYNATAAAVQTALNALASISAIGGVTVTQTGTVYRVLFNTVADYPLMTATAAGGATAVINPIYGLNVSKPITLNGNGVNNAGALDSLSGINIYSGAITLGNIQPADGIGVSLDSRPGHPTADNSYFTNDYSLTVTGAITSGQFTTLNKEGPGNLILPNANPGLVGATFIDHGWVTVQNDDSLGLPIANPADGPTVQPDHINVNGTAALQLLPLTPTSDINLANNLILNGLGLPNTNPYSLIAQAGAVESLGGLNTLSGNIEISGAVGFGVELTGAFPVSQLTTTGTISDTPNNPVFPGSLWKLGSQRLILQGPGTFTGAVDVRSGELRVDEQHGAGDRQQRHRRHNRHASLHEHHDHRGIRRDPGDGELHPGPQRRRSGRGAGLV